MKKLVCLATCTVVCLLNAEQRELAVFQQQLSKLTETLKSAPQPAARQVELTAVDYLKYLDEELPKLKNTSGVSADTIKMLEGVRELLRAGRPVESVIPEAPALSGDVPVAPSAPVIDVPQKSKRKTTTSVKPLPKVGEKNELLAAIRKGATLKKTGAAPAAKEAGREALLKAVQQGPTLKKAGEKKTAQPLSGKELLAELTKKFADAAQVKAPLLLVGHIGEILKYLNSVDWKSIKERTTVVAAIDAQVTKFRTAIQQLLANKAVVDGMKDLVAFVNNATLQAKLAARMRLMEGEEEESSTWETE